ncbi:hypothetical protein [Kribbella sancticallisti]
MAIVGLDLDEPPTLGRRWSVEEVREVSLAELTTAIRTNSPTAYCASPA